jgi:hypothetical protein
MQLESTKAILAALWLSGVWAAGIAADLDSLSPWTMPASVGVLSLLVTVGCWRVQRQSMSEARLEALR